MANKSFLGMGVTPAAPVGRSAGNPDIRPMSHDPSGTMECSAGTPARDGACGWRAPRADGGGAETWMASIAISDRAACRVAEFDRGGFAARDGTPLEVEKTADVRAVSVPGREYCRFPDAAMTGG